MEENHAPPGSVTVIRNMTPEQRAVIWQDTVRDPEGYMRMTLWPKDVNLLPDLRKEAKRAPAMTGAPELRPGHVLPTNMTHGGTIAEDRHRTTFVFDDPRGGAALTVWDFRKAGGKMTVFDDMLNQVIDGTRGTLTLSVDKSSRDALWKLGWQKDGIGYEAYVPTTLDVNGKPQRNATQMVVLAGTLAAQVKAR